MKSLTFIFVSLLSGVIAGVILAGVNYFVAEPFIDQAIGIEVDNSIASGEVVDFDELSPTGCGKRKELLLQEHS